MADVARTIHQPRGVAEILEPIAHAACDTIPGINHAGVTVPGNGSRPKTQAATDDFALEADILQYDLDEGPCLDALRDDVPFAQADHLSDDQRWPRYAPRAAALGVRSQMAFQLCTDETTLGALNLYSSRNDVLDPCARSIAALFASHASLALGGAKERDNLDQALVSRKLIGQATGIVQERYGLDEERAFQFLVRVSRTSNVKLRHLAADLVSQPVNRKRPADAIA